MVLEYAFNNLRKGFKKKKFYVRNVINDLLVCVFFYYNVPRKFLLLMEYCQFLFS